MMSDREFVLHRGRRLAEVAQPSVKGSGNCHDLTIGLAVSLTRGLLIPPDDALEILRTVYNPRSTPPNAWKDSELVHKVRQSLGFATGQADGWLLDDDGGRRGRSRVRSDWEPKGVGAGGGRKDAAGRAAREKPRFVPEALRRVSNARIGEISRAYLADRSPVPPHLVSAEDFLGLLFEPEERVAIVAGRFNDKCSFLCEVGRGEDAEHFEPAGDFVRLPVRFFRTFTRWGEGGAVEAMGREGEPMRRISPRGWEEGAWFLANPVCGEPLPNAEGGLSWRSEANVSAWRWAVVESDVAGFERAWVTVLSELPVPIGAIYSSGRKSVHALLRIDAGSKEEWDAEVGMAARILVELGADRRALTAVRLTRLPQLRRGRELQALHFLNPAAAVGDRVPICDRLPLRDVAGSCSDSARLREFYRLQPPAGA